MFMHDVIMILRHSDQQTNRYHDHLCTVHTIYFLHLSTDCTIMDFHASSGEPKDDPVTTVVSLSVCKFVLGIVCSFTIPGIRLHYITQH